MNGRNNTLIGRLEKAGTKLRQYNNFHHYMHTQFHVLSLMYEGRLHVSCIHIQILLMKGVLRSTHLLPRLPVQPPLVLVWYLWEAPLTPLQWVWVPVCWWDNLHQLHYHGYDMACYKTWKFSSGQRTFLIRTAGWYNVQHLRLQAKTNVEEDKCSFNFSGMQL